MTASRTRRIALALLLAIEVCAAGAWAEPDEAARAAARAHMAEGRARRERGDLVGALASFVEADGIMRVPTTSLEAAKTQAELGQLVEAWQTLKGLLARPVASDEPVAFARARAEAAILYEELEQRVPRLRFDVQGVDATTRAGILVDGRPVPRELWQSGYAVNPGPQTVVLLAPATRQERKLYLAERSSETVRFDLAGRGQTVPASASRQRAPEPTRQEDSDGGGISPAVYGFGGVSLFGLSAGVTFGILGKRRKSELEMRCAPNCTSAEVDSVQTTYTLANVAFGVSAVAAAAAITLYALEPSAGNEKSGATVKLRAGAVPGSAGMAVDGRF